MSETTITGSTIIATIKNMSALGHIGQKVLLEQGIKEIIPDQQYPYTIRSQIHEAAHKRFGDDALFAFGLFQMDAMHEVGRFAGVLDRLQQFYKSNAARLDSDNDTIAEKSLEELYFTQNEVTDSLLKKATIGPFDGYGCHSKKVDHLVYEMHGVQAAWLQHYANFQGSVFGTLSRFLANNWEISFEFQRDKSESGDGWAEYVYLVRFNRLRTEKSLTETRIQIVSDVKEKLLKAVLADSEKQTERIELIASKLGKYLPPQIHDAFFSGDYDTDIATRRKKLTIFFSDIKNFTSTSEGLQPEDLTKYLNEYFSEMTAIALDFGATIDKYIGDAMMVFFGDPESKGEKKDARACVEMALRMQERMIELQEKWKNQGFSEPFQVRMGMNTGYCNVGNFGSDQRLTYTIIGGEVNVAQRLEANADANGILMSYETYAHAQDMVDVEQREAIKMKGINREIKIFSIKSRAYSLNDTEDTKDEKRFNENSVDEKNQTIEKRLANIERQLSSIAKFIKKDR